MQRMFVHRLELTEQEPSIGVPVAAVVRMDVANVTNSIRSYGGVKLRSGADDTIFHTISKTS